MKNNMPTIAVHDLVIHPRENDLVVATHGRSIFIADISPLQELTDEVLTKDVHLFDIEPKVQWRMTRQPSVSAQNFAGENEPSGVVINYYLKEPIKGDLKLSIYDGDELINEIIGPNAIGINTVGWGMTKRKSRTAIEMKEWEEEQKMLTEEEEFFDYYDAVEIFPSEDEEVDRFGRSMRTRVHFKPGLTHKEYKYTRVNPGTYKVVLTTNGKTLSKNVLILEDKWYDK
jgi:hypothetical protein